MKLVDIADFDILRSYPGNHDTHYDIGSKTMVLKYRLNHTSTLDILIIFSKTYLVLENFRVQII